MNFQCTPEAFWSLLLLKLLKNTISLSIRLQLPRGRQLHTGVCIVLAATSWGHVLGRSCSLVPPPSPQHPVKWGGSTCSGGCCLLASSQRVSFPEGCSEACRRLAIPSRPLQRSGGTLKNQRGIKLLCNPEPVLGSPAVSICQSGGSKPRHGCCANEVALNWYSPCAFPPPPWRVKVTCPAHKAVACGWNVLP